MSDPTPLPWHCGPRLGSNGRYYPGGWIGAGHKGYCLATTDTLETAERIVAAVNLQPTLRRLLADIRPYVAHAADDPAEPDNPAAARLRELDAMLHRLDGDA
jgi:hypothetical protein